MDFMTLMYYAFLACSLLLVITAWRAIGSKVPWPIAVSAILVIVNVVLLLMQYGEHSDIHDFRFKVLLTSLGIIGFLTAKVILGKSTIGPGSGAQRLEE